MTDDLMRLSVIGQLVRKRWRVLVTWAVLGAVLGAGASLLFSPGYETTSSVLLQGPREDNELLTETQVATSSVVLERTAGTLGMTGNGGELRDSVTATVVNGGVIEISVTADDPAQAKRVADTVAEEYVSFATELVTSAGDVSAQLMQEQRAILRQQVDATNRRISELHASTGQGLTVESVQVRTELQALRGELQEAIQTLDEAEAAAGRVNMAVLGPALHPTSQAAPTMAHFVGGGALLLLLLAASAQLLAIRADRSGGALRDPADIATALGAPVLGTVDVPEPAVAEPTPSLGRRLVRLLWDDRPWEAERQPPGGADTGTRYRRVLAKLPEVRRLLVLVPAGDLRARHVAERLSATATTAGAGERTDWTMEVVEVLADQPVVPDGRGSALVVLTTRTRTALDLAVLAAACADAGRELAGAVVVRPTAPGPAPAEPEQSAVDTPAEVLAGAP